MLGCLLACLLPIETMDNKELLQQLPGDIVAVCLAYEYTAREARPYAYTLARGARPFAHTLAREARPIAYSLLAERLHVLSLLE